MNEEKNMKTREKVKAFSEYRSVLLPDFGWAVAILQRFPVKCLHMENKEFLIAKLGFNLSNMQSNHSL